MEAKLLPVDDHLNLLSTQFLAIVLQPSHPSHSIVTRPPGPRKLRKTIQSRCKNDILGNQLVNGALLPEACRGTLMAIHTQIMDNARERSAPNPVLNQRPPDISKTASELPRAMRTTLDQLRSSHCIRLQSYLERVGRSPTPECPHCKQADQTTNHLFQCTSFPTSLSPRDLWVAPIKVTNFLIKHPDFSDLRKFFSPPHTSPPSSP